MFSLMAALAFAGAIETAPQQAAAGGAAPITVTIDPDRSIDTGANLTFAAVSALSELEARAVDRLKRGPLTNISAGIVKAVFVDHPIAVFLLVVQHEAFGHGGRAREFGAAATFSMGSPWTRNMLFNGGTRFGGGARWEDVLTPEQDGRIYAGGTEANSRSATHIERELVAGTAMRPMQLLYYVRSRWYPSQYVLRTPRPDRNPAGFFEESSGGDVPNYLAELNRKYFGESGITHAGVSPTLLNEFRRLRRHALINLTTPGTWLALWAAGRDVGIGSRPGPIPALHIGGRRFLPIVNADWMVDGGAISVEAIVGARPGQTSGPRWFSLLTRQGNGPGGRFWNAGAATEKVARWKAIEVGGEFELWRQPSFGTGAGINANIVVRTGALRGMLMFAGVKSDGDWPGRPANRGGFFRVGYRYRG